MLAFLKKHFKVGIVIFVLCFIMMIIIIASVIASVIAGAGDERRQPDLDTVMVGLPSILTKEMVYGAIISQEKYGVPASLTLAQIVLESGGSYLGGLSQLAYECKNLFGIKGEGPAGYKEYTTAEQTSSGGAYTVTARFRKYNNFKESIDDHGQLLTTPRYAVYTSTCTTSDEWAVAIHKAGYATDVAYPSKLINIMKLYNLYLFDNMSKESVDSYFEGDGKSSGSLLWPLSIKGVITSPFGDRLSPTAGATAVHDGIDIAGPSGTAILAADGGVVKETGYNSARGYYIYITHDKGIVTLYQHLRNDGILVRAGQKVSKGMQIGRMGSSGISTGSHLHFEVISGGRCVNPLNYVKQPN